MESEESRKGDAGTFFADRRRARPFDRNQSASDISDELLGVPVDRGKITAANRSRDCRRYVLRIGRVKSSLFLIRAGTFPLRPRTRGRRRTFRNRSHSRNRRQITRARARVARRDNGQPRIIYTLYYIFILSCDCDCDYQWDGTLEARGSIGSWKLDLDFRLHSSG